MSGSLTRHNRLLVLAREGRRQPSAITAIVVAFVTLAVSLIGGQILRRALIPLILGASAEGPLAEGVRDLVTFACGFVPIYLCLWAWLALWCKRPFSSLGFEDRHPLRHALAGTSFGIVMMSLVAGGLAVLPRTTSTQGGLFTYGIVAGGGALLTLGGTIIQSSGEEVLFRGWLLPTIGARYGAWVGIVVSSLLFGGAHAINPNATLLGLFNLSLFGAFLALLALAEGGLWAACAWHAMWNWTDNTLLGLPDSGGPSRIGVLVSIHPGGHRLVTGGAFGPDGGLVETAVLLIGIAVTAWRVSRAR